MVIAAFLSGVAIGFFAGRDYWRTVTRRVMVLLLTQGVLTVDEARFERFTKRYKL